MSKSRVLGSCYLCGKQIYGTTIVPGGTLAIEQRLTERLTDLGRRFAVRDVNGIRHGGKRACTPTRTENVNPSHA